ncbi:lipoprotein [Streptomyces phage ClubPenguin]|nr:lipoprotein [Streptomyces phage ClubPenguin]
MRKVLALLALIVSIFTLASCGTSHGVSASKKPTSLVGEWNQINASRDGWMTASISGESIQVNLRGRDSSTVFWMGSFDTHKRTATKYKVVSLGDQDAMKYEIFASTEKKKTFTYDHGVLSFVFSMGKSSTVIHMKKSTTHIPTATPTTRRPSVNKPTPQTRTPKPKSTKAAKIKTSTPKLSTSKKK